MIYNMFNAVSQKYIDAGWTVCAMPAGSSYELLAHRTTNAGKKPKIHFVQFIGSSEDVRRNSDVRNVFIQNALSNMAVPVFAELVGKTCRLVDVNDNTSIVLRRVSQGVSSQKPSSGDQKSINIKSSDKSSKK